MWAGGPLSCPPSNLTNPGLANYSSLALPCHRSSFLVCKVVPWIILEGCPGSCRMGFPPQWSCGTLDILRLREDRRAVVWFLKRGPEGPEMNHADMAGDCPGVADPAGSMRDSSMGPFLAWPLQLES